MKIDRITIVIIIVVAILLLGGAILVWQSPNITAFLNKEISGQENIFSPAEYAAQKGYNRYFQHQGQWYANVNGEWRIVSSKEEARQLSAPGGQ